LRVAICLVGALLLVSCSPTEPVAESQGESHVVHWGYEADDGPEKWASMSSEWSLCGEGREQSPIDLADPAPTELPAVKIDTPSDQEVEVLNCRTWTRERRRSCSGTRYWRCFGVEVC
jgi:carbonic anhydrase